ncbi:MAG: imidazole glycerol phosphate synthase subunit HisH, partial [Bacteroidota bacterium]
ANVKVPQIGCNTIQDLKSPSFEDVRENEYMYIVHSYYAKKSSEMIAESEYDIQYASALQKDNFFGVQFHPEKSSKAGSKILENFLKL